jgi:O-antigen/teichoic acid export membrane protein
MRYTLKSFSQNVFAQVAVQLLLVSRALFILPILYKTLGRLQYGIWTQISVTVTLLAAVLTLRFDIVLVRYFTSTSQNEEFRSAFSSMLTGILLLLVPFSLAVGLFPEGVSRLLFGDPGFAQYIFILIGLIALKSLFLYALAFYRAKYRIGLYSLIQSLQIAGEVIFLFIWIVLFRSSLLTSLVALLIFNLLITCGTLLYVLIEVGVARPSWSSVKPYLLFSLPLIPNVGLQWIINFSDRYLIVHFLNLDEVSIYAACYTLGHMVTFFITPVAFVLYPMISKLWQEDKKKEMTFWATNSLKLFLIFAVPAVLGLHTLAPVILERLTTDDFITHRWLVLLIASGYFFVGVYQIFLYLIHLLEKTYLIMIIVLCVAATNVLLNLMLIPQWGIEGAAISTLISYGAQAVIVYLYAIRYFKIQLPYGFILKAGIGSVLMYAVLTLFEPVNLLQSASVAFVGVLIYGVVMVVLGAVRKDELVRLQKALIK